MTGNSFLGVSTGIIQGRSSQTSRLRRSSPAPAEADTAGDEGRRQILIGPKVHSYAIVDSSYSIQEHENTELTGALCAPYPSARTSFGCRKAHGAVCSSTGQNRNPRNQAWGPAWAEPGLLPRLAWVKVPRGGLPASSLSVRCKGADRSDF